MKSPHLSTSENEIDFIINRLCDLSHHGRKDITANFFPSYRYSRYFNFQIPDDNFFFTASSLYLMERCLPMLPSTHQNTILHLCDLAKSQFVHFRNKDGKISYNFWRTKPSNHFPNGKLFKHLDYFRLPDDSDDTALAFLVENKSDEELSEFYKLTLKHSNGHFRSIKKIPQKYRHFKAIETFFGKAIAVEFDISVLCNVLSVFYRYKLNLHEGAVDSIAYIRQMIVDNLILKSPYSVSPNYGRTSIVYYHIVRLITDWQCKAFDDLIPRIIEDIKTMPIENSLDLLLREITLLKLGEKRTEVPFFPESNHAFFVAGMLNVFENRLCQYWAKYDFFHIKFSSAAFNYTLYLYYLLLLEGNHDSD